MGGAHFSVALMAAGALLVVRQLDARARPSLVGPEGAQCVLFALATVLALVVVAPDEARLCATVGSHAASAASAASASVAHAASAASVCPARTILAEVVEQAMISAMISAMLSNALSNAEQ